MVVSKETWLFGHCQGNNRTRNRGTEVGSAFEDIVSECAILNGAKERSMNAAILSHVEENQ